MRVTGGKGRSSSFEVTGRIETPMGVQSDAALLYSKLATSRFPDTNQLIAAIQRWATTGKVQ